MAAGRSMLGKLARSSRSRNLLGEPPQFLSASTLLIRNTAFGSSVAWYISTSSFSCPAAKTRSQTTGMLSIITHPMKPAFVDSVRGPKRTFSSKIIKHSIDWEAERAATEARLEASKKISSSTYVEARNAKARADFERRKAWLDNLTDTANADLAAWREQMDKDAAEFDRLVNGILCVLAAMGFYGLYIMHSSLECHRKAQIAARANVEDQNP